MSSTVLKLDRLAWSCLSRCRVQDDKDLTACCLLLPACRASATGCAGMTGQWTLLRSAVILCDDPLGARVEIPRSHCDESIVTSGPQENTVGMDDAFNHKRKAEQMYESCWSALHLDKSGEQQCKRDIFGEVRVYAHCSFQKDVTQLRGRACQQRTHRIHYTAELSQHPVAGVLDNSPAMFGHFGIDEKAQVRRDAPSEIEWRPTTPYHCPVRPPAFRGSE